MNGRDMNRREFLKTSAVVAGGLALSRAVSADTASPASERIRYALIGCGGMGNAHLDAVMRLKASGYPVEIAAVCDVYSLRAESAAKKTGAKIYGDYQEVLERKDIDAVGIATPDHWHSRMAVEAAQAGKDIYCEKPMTHWRDLDEAKKIVDAISTNKRVLQVGTQGMSDSIWEQISEKIKAGAVGKLIHAQASDMRNGPLGVYDPKSNDGQAKPGVNLNWDMWLGPAKKRAWDPGRFFAFRSFWDYSGGVGTDFFPHILTPLVRSMNLDFPSKVTAIGGQYVYTTDGREIPDIYNLTIEYPDGPVVLLMGAIANGVNIPMIIRGHEGSVYPREAAGFVIRPEGAVVSDAKESVTSRTRGESLDEHYKDFLDCIKTRNKPRSNELLGYRVMCVLHMGVHSYLEGRTMQFNPTAGKASPV